MHSLFLLSIHIHTLLRSNSRIFEHVANRFPRAEGPSSPPHSHPSVVISFFSRFTADAFSLLLLKTLTQHLHRLPNHFENRRTATINMREREREGARNTRCCSLSLSLMMIVLLFWDLIFFLSFLSFTAPAKDPYVV